MKKASAPEVIPSKPGTPFVGGLFCWRLFDEKGPYALVVATQDGDFGNVTHANAKKKCAAYRGGKQKGWTLPTRAEALAMFEHLRPAVKAAEDAFVEDAYWTSQDYERVGGYAWYQNFGLGYQDNYGKDYSFRARAVRRVRI